MSIFINKLCVAIIASSTLITSQLFAGDLEDLLELKKNSIQELAKLKTIGKGEKHPQVIAKEKLIIEIEDKINNCKESHEELIILLKGTTSLHMKGHSMFQKTEHALPTLLLQGWKIKNMVPAGEQQAYVWLTRE